MTSAGFEHEDSGTRGQHANHQTTKAVDFYTYHGVKRKGSPLALLFALDILYFGYRLLYTFVIQNLATQLIEQVNTFPSEFN